jgi:hypothetical protein
MMSCVGRLMQSQNFINRSSIPDILLVVPTNFGRNCNRSDNTSILLFGIWNWPAWGRLIPEMTSRIDATTTFSFSGQLTPLSHIVDRFEVKAVFHCRHNGGMATCGI